MQRAVLLLLVALAGCSTIQLGGSLGDPDSTRPTLPLGLLWERDADGAFGPSAAQVTERYVVVGTRNGEVVVINRQSGRVEGTGEFGDSVEGQLAVSADGETIYVPTAEQDGGVVAYDVRRGRQIWRWLDGGIQGGVVRLDSSVVLLTLDGRVVGLDPTDGSVAWERPASDAAQYHGAPVRLDADVLVADDRGRVVRLDGVTGAEHWRAEVGGPVYATPAVADGAVYISTTRGGLARLDAAGGEVVWTVQDAQPLRVSTAAIGPTALAVGFSDGTVRGVDLTSGDELWRYAGDGAVTAAPVWIGDRVAVGTLDKRLVVIDGSTGREEWSTELRGRVKSALAVGGGLLIALVEPRHVVAFHSAP